MRRALLSMLVLLAGNWLTVPAAAQEKPLERSFSVGASSAYHVELTVRSEVEGQQSEPIGSKMYVGRFSRVAEIALGWRAVRRVLEVDAEGTASMEEVLDNFEIAASGPAPSDAETARLAGALREGLAGWRMRRTLRYRETRAGQLLDLKADGAPPLGEAPPALLSLWLLRALRPAATLPPTPIRFGQSWQEPRAVRLPNWDEVRASETGEWLEPRESAEPAVRLHIVQQVSGTVVAGGERSPEGMAQGRFHGESLASLSLTDLRLLAATRSATREITWTLAPVEGLSERPQFRGRLSAQARIEVCDEDSCSSSGAAAGLGR